ncbi:hypothetical protein HDU85_001218 [Gaertneriomyces sp. JEL0708]|nr:hypothetical protein HDU85_001218 [Gaertneriomyces sp. JEL0708]
MADNVKGFQTQVALGGITVEHHLLVDTDTPSQVHPFDAAFKNPVDGIAIVGESTIFDDAIEQTKQSPQYSDCLGVTLTKNMSHYEGKVDQSRLRSASDSLQDIVRRFTELKRVEMEERVAAFRAEQQALWEAQQQRAQEDKNLLWATICQLHGEQPANAHAAPHVEAPTSPVSILPGTIDPMKTGSAGASWAGTSFLNASSLYLRAGGIPQSRRQSSGNSSLSAAMDKTSPQTTALSSPTMPESPTSKDVTTVSGDLSRKVHFDSNARDTNGHQAHKSKSKDEDAIFDLDEDADVNDDRHSDSDASEDLEGTPNETEPIDSPTTIPSAHPFSIFSTSVPVYIPGRFNPLTEPDLPPELADELEAPPRARYPDDDTEDFVAPHILSARTFTDDYLLSMRPPKSRKQSLAI